MSFVNSEEETPAALDNRIRPKRTYSAPQVIKYGTVVQLTQGVGGSTYDPGHNNNSKRGGGIA